MIIDEADAAVAKSTPEGKAKAIEQYKLALQHFPNHPRNEEIQIRLATLLSEVLGEKNLKNASELAEEIIERHNGNAETCFSLNARLLLSTTDRYLGGKSEALAQLEYIVTFQLENLSLLSREQAGKPASMRETKWRTWQRDEAQRIKLAAAQALVDLKLEDIPQYKFQDRIERLNELASLHTNDVVYQRFIADYSQQMTRDYIDFDAYREKDIIDKYVRDEVLGVQNTP